MAYVKITGDFKDRVRAKIRKMKDEAMRQFQVDELVIDTPEHIAISEIATASTWGEHLHLKELIPRRWCAEVESVTVKFLDLPPVDGRDYHSVLVGLTGEHRYMPPGTNRWSMGDVVIKASSCQKIVRDWLDGIVHAEARRKECEDKFKTIDSQIMAFLRKHVSLNTAIKELPELEMYVHSEDMERLRRKVERYATNTHEVDAKEEVDVDLELLTSTAVAARISGVK